MLVADNANTTNDDGSRFDAGPLSWVQSEIDEALSKSLEALEAFAAAPQDGTHLKHARTHVHQAAGAIQMVGLDAVVAFTDEIERQLARLEELSASDASKACTPIDRACRKLRIFLDELVSGAAPVPLKLFPEYEAMQCARGLRAAAPTDLFFPDLSAHAPRARRPVSAATNMPSFLVKQRRLFQRGLLAWLRGQDDGARQMREAIGAIEEMTTQANLRAFWWSTGALLEALIERGLEASFGVKQLAARVDLQIRRLAEGSSKVADRLRREVLYYVAISAPVAPSVEAVQRVFRLTGLIPSAEVLSADVVGIQPHLREARDQLATAKDTWLKYTSGRAENLPKLKQTLASVHKQAAAIGNGALMKLTSALVSRLDRLANGNVSEAMAMEYATALLLAESAFRNYANLSAEFPQQVDVMLARLEAAQASRPFADGEATPVLEEMSRRAQDRLLLAQVGREIQANLRHMEQVLDAFFRDHSKRGELVGLVKDSAQVRGALRMLELETAEQLLASCEEQIASYADAATPITDEDLELLAESLSGLGFYIEAVEQQRADHERLIAPILAKRRGEAPPPVVETTDTVEAAVEELRNALPELIAEVHRAPTDMQARESLREKLTVLRDDAELIGDDELVVNAKAALAELEQGATTGAAITAIVETAAPAPAPEVSQETQRLLDSGEHALDAELLEIFLAEAAEVLDTVSEQHRILGHNGSDREALRTARRQFHTLKGSGRMVGLTDLAEIAYDIEKIHNRLLEEERTVTPAVLALIATGEAEFRAWVAELREKGCLHPDPQRVHQAIHAVEEELPRGRESVLAGREVKPAPASAAPAAPPAKVDTPVSPLDVTLLERAPETEAAATISRAPVTQATELSDADALESVFAAYRGAELELQSSGAVVPAHNEERHSEALSQAAVSAPAEPELPTLAEVGAAHVASTSNVVEEVGAFDDTVHDTLPPLELDMVEVPEASPEPAASDARSADAANLINLSTPEDVALPPIAEIDLELPEPDEPPATVPQDGYVEDAAALDDIDLAMRDAIQSVEEIVAASPPSYVPHLTLVPATDAESANDSALSQDPAAVNDELTIGSVKISRALYEILVAEADEHLATLSHELALMQFEPGYLVSAAIVRASHTLCGIHRTGGFALVPATAKALEQCLLAMQQRAVKVGAPSHAVIARAVDVLSALVARVRDKQAFTTEDARVADDVQRELEALRQETQTTPGDSVAGHAPADVPQHSDFAADAAPVAIVAPIASDATITMAEAPETVEPVPQLAAPQPRVEAPHVVDMEQAVDVQQPAAGASAHMTVVENEGDAAEDESLVLSDMTQAPAPTETPLDQINDEVDDQLLPIFLEEAEELFPQAGEQLRNWRKNPPDQTHASALRRTLHTFKGSARMAGAMRLGELAHRMESRLLRGEDLEAGSPELFEALDADLDRVAFVLDALREGRSNIALPWLETAPAAAAPKAVHPVETKSVVHQVSTGQEISGVVVPLPGVTGFATPSPQPAAPLAAVAESDSTQRAMLRVRADVIDRLVNETGEVAIARSRVEGELRALKANLLELTNSVIRMREQVREIEIQAESQIQSRLSMRGETHADFDPLEFDRFTRFQELTRSLAEGINDVSTVQQSLIRNIDDADAALAAQSRLSREIQQQLFAIRTVPFGSLSERLYRILRQVAKELDKRVNLDIRGSQVELDRSVLEKLVGPLEHLLRNALDHGIESREARAHAGKPPTGEIVVTVRQVGNEIAIELADDGAGLDLERIRARAIAQGRIAPDAKPSDAQLVECIFQPGFSTASRVTHVSGRGIGMDVVRAEIAALGGRVEVSSRPGKGTTFLLYLPLTLAVAQAVLVRAGGRLWALPAPMVEQVQQVKAENLVELYANRRLRWQGRAYSFHYLPRLLGDTEHSPVTGKFNPVLLLRTGQGVTAVHVDEMVGNQEVVVKNIGPQLARIAGIAGATVLGSGEIVLIINPVQLAQRADIPDFNPFAEEHVASTSHGEATLRLPLAMVVDDSLTVRKITSRMLAREGFDVVTAKDGIEALQRLEERRPDVILLDIEMPRMDGFEFAKTIKADARHATIPIIMITSRTAEKHRNRARELGVDLYLGKPYQEQELLRNLREMLSVAA